MCNMPAIVQNICHRCVPQKWNLPIVKFFIFLYSLFSILDEVYAQRCISGSAIAQLPSYLDQKHVNSSAKPTKAALFCAPGLKADVNTLQNHNHPHMNCLPFLMSKKWEAVQYWLSFDVQVFCSGLSCLLSACHLSWIPLLEPCSKQAHSNRNQVVHDNQNATHSILNCKPAPNGS